MPQSVRSTKPRMPIARELPPNNKNRSQPVPELLRWDSGTGERTLIWLSFASAGQRAL